MNLAEARSTVLNGALHIGDNTDDRAGGYGVDSLDRAIRFAGNLFVEATRCTQTVTSVSLTSGSHIINLTATSGMSLFRPQNYIWGNISGYPVKPTALHTAQRYYQGSTPMGRPVMVSFEGPTRAWIQPEPDQSYTWSVFWYAPFTAWEIGTGEPAGVTLNIPDQYLDIVLRFGAATAMVYSDPDSLYANQGFQRFLEFTEQTRAQLDYPLTGEKAGDVRTYTHNKKPKEG